MGVVDCLLTSPAENTKNFDRTPGARKKWSTGVQTATLLFGCLAVAAIATFSWYRFADSIIGPDQVDVDNDPPAIQQPQTYTAPAEFIPERMEVVGVSAGGKHRAYLLLAITPVQTSVINDVVGTLPVTVSFCDRTKCIKVFKGTARGVPLAVSVAGWRQFANGSREGMVVKVNGKRYHQSSGKALDSADHFPYAEHSFTRTTWKAWKQAHPDTDVYLGQHPLPTVSPGSQHPGNSAPMIDADLDLPPIQQPRTYPGPARLIPERMVVIGVSAGGKHRAYLLSALTHMQTHVINDVLGTLPVTVSYCDRTECVKVFKGTARGVPLAVSVAGWRQFANGGRGGMVVKVNGKRYHQSSGKALDSADHFPYAEHSFTRTTWKAWKQAHPDTDVYLGQHPLPTVSPGSHLPPDRTPPEAVVK
jgi:hypothetical protein